MKTKITALTTATPMENTTMTTKTTADSEDTMMQRNCNDDGKYNDDDKDNIVHN